ncbi:hypothetical protein EMIT0194P_80026 [Pseudomonas serbica]
MRSWSVLLQTREKLRGGHGCPPFSFLKYLVVGGVENGRLTAEQEDKAPGDPYRKNEQYEC